MRAAAQLGPYGCARVIAVWLEALCYSNRFLTDGFISNAAARGFHADRTPLQVMRKMASRNVRLMRRNRSGFWIHDFDQYQLSKSEIEERRRKERDRKRSVRADVTRNLRGRDGSGTPGTPGTVQDQDQEQSAPARTLNGQVSESRRSLLKIAHGVYADLDAGRLTADELTEELKTRAALAHIRYDGDRVRKALDSADVQRHRL